MQLFGSQAAVKYRYNARAWLEDEEDEEATPTESANQQKVDKLKRPLQLKKVTVYPDKIGESISTQVKVRQDQKMVGKKCFLFFSPTPTVAIMIGPKSRSL